MAHIGKYVLPEWKPQVHTRARFGNMNYEVRYRALRHSSSGYIHREDVRAIVMSKCNYQCVKCGNKSYLEVDHIVSVYRCAKGEFPVDKLNLISNLQILCKACNGGKSP